MLVSAKLLLILPRKFTTFLSISKKRMKKINFLFLFFYFLTLLSTKAQVGINILNPDTSAILHLESTTRGLLFPRLDTTQIANIFSPKAGLQVYNVTDSLMQYYNGRCWLYTWQRNCDDCAFNFRIQRNTGSIDRIFTNSDSTRLYINQVAGANQSIPVYIIPNLPQGITASLNRLIVNGNDSVTVTVTADIFAPAGTYPIIIQAVCGNTISSQVFIVTVEPCIQVAINTPQVNYNLQLANNLPTATPICVVATIGSGVQLSSTVPSAVFNTGSLHPSSRVGILNNGDLLARGGDGGLGAGVGGGGATGGGQNGTDGINISVHTHIINNGKIFAGGGGGGSVGFVASIPLGITTLNLGLGAGGGGGAQAGIGGNLGTGLGFYAAGQSATLGFNAFGGAGGVLTTPINFGISVVNITLTPQVFGGNGGNYGIDGTSGTLSVNVLAQISVPFVGTVTILNQGFPNPPITNFAAGGVAGFAVRKNGNTLLGISNGIYLSNSIKGRVN
jgi:hypothetical protein